MNSLSRGQIFALCFATGFFFVFSSNCAQSFSQTIGIVLAMLAMFVIIGLCAWLAPKREYGALAHTLTLCLEICAGAGCIASFFNAESNADFGIDHRTMLAVLLSAAVIYCASLGIKTAARCAVIISALTVFAIFLLFVGAFSKASLDNLHFEPDAAKSLDFAFESFALSALPAIASALFVNKHTDKKSFGVFLGAAISALSGVALSTLYQAINIETPSYFALSAAAQPFAVQSGEWIYIIIYGMLSVLTLSLVINLASDSLKRIFPKIKYSVIICAILVFALSAAMPYFNIKTKAIILAADIIAVPSVLFGHPARK